MNKLARFMLLLSVATLLMAACTDQQEPEETKGSAITTLDDLVTQMRDAGTTVEVTGEVSQPFFSPVGQVITVNEQDVQVFEYGSESNAEAEADLVAPDGSSVGTSMMSWIATPHFFKSGRLIVLYVGDDAITVETLVEILGAQFAGG